MKKITPFLLGLGLTLIMVGGFLSSSPKDVGAATVVSLGKNGTSEYLLYPTDTLSAYTFIATSTTASSSFANGINLTGGCFAIGSVCLPTLSANNTWTGAQTFGTLTASTGTIDHLITDELTAKTSGGSTFRSANGTPVSVLGVGNSANVLFYGGVNIDGAVRMATSLNGLALLTNGAVTSIATSSLGLLTTDVAEGTNLYFTNGRVQTYLDTLSKGYFFSTTSADYWLTTKSLTSASSTLLGDTNTWSATNQFAKLTFTNATGTGATTTNFAISSVASKILLTNATGGISGYAGASCTNQFVRSLSALGAATCATVGAADVSLANLTATNGTLTFSGTYNGATARTIGLNLGNSNAWTALQTFNTAGVISTASSTIALLSSTNSTTTNATSTNSYVSGTLTGVSGSYSGVITPIKNLSLYYGTTTTWTGTTSGAHITTTVAPFAGTIRTAQCKTDTGTLNVDIYHTSTHLALFNASTTVGTITFSSNNTFTNGEPIYFSAGTPASTPTSVACTLNITQP